MKRRDFIRASSIAGAAFPLLIINGCNVEVKHDQNQAIGITKPEEFELNEATIEVLQQKMQQGKLSSKDITNLYLKRIDAIDKNGVKLNSVIEINPDALTIAEALDNERREGKVRGPLHGIPVLIKDNIDTADKMMTTAGSMALEGNHALKDSFVVKKLREGGAVILGKTNLSEWANFRSTHSTSGWSSRGGQTKNPYILDRNPCGSSSGSGAAVASNLCAVALGTETNGSIACPASINGIVGIKPTVGLVSRSGIIPLSSTQDTAGPMARTVRDAAILLGVIAGSDPEDAVTKESKGKTKPDYTAFLQDKGLDGKKIGIEKSFLKGHIGVDALLQQAIDQMKQGGAVIVEVELMDKLKIDNEEFDVLKYEFKDGLNKYLAGANGKVKSLKELIAFNKANEEKTMPYFKQEILESSEEKGDLQTKEYQEALKKVLLTRKVIDDLIKERGLDAIAGPTNGPSWCTDLINGNYFTGYGMYGPAAMAGYPSISVPMGLVENLPVGLAFIAGAYQEPELIAIAYAYEQASKKRVQPKFLKSFGA
jgi:amidase